MKNTPQVLNPADIQPFATTNAVLAYCLYKAGVPWSDPSRPCWNVYDRATLFRIGGGEKDANGNVTNPSRFKGMSDEAATKAAFEAGEKGRVEFLFRMVPPLSGLLRAFTEQENELRDGDGTAAEVSMRLVREFGEGKMAEDELLLRLACVDLKMRGQFMNLWKLFPPIVQRENSGKPQLEDVKVRNAKGDFVPAKQVTLPGCKMWSVNLSEVKRKQLGIT